MGYWPKSWGDEGDGDVVLKKVDGSLQLHPTARIAVVVLVGAFSLGGVWVSLNAQQVKNTEDIAEVQTEVSKVGTTVNQVRTDIRVVQEQIKLQSEAAEARQERIERQLDRLIEQRRNN